MTSRHFTTTVDTWEQVARTDQASRAIHPTGNDPDGYAETGRIAADEFAEIVPPDDRTIVDFACGDGRVAVWLTERYRTVIGVDVSQTMLTRCVRRAPAVVPFRWDGLDPFRVEGLAGIVDGPPISAVFSINVLLHHEYLDGAAILENLAGLLPEGGDLAVQIPLYDQPHTPEGWTSVGTWTPTMFEAAAENAGLEIEAMHTNAGTFGRDDNIGPNHSRLHHLTRR